MRGAAERENSRERRVGDGAGKSSSEAGLPGDWLRLRGQADPWADPTSHSVLTHWHSLASLAAADDLILPGD